MSDIENPSTDLHADGPDVHNIKDPTDFGKGMWSYLTGRSAVTDDSFVDLTIEAPRDVGPDAPRATWKLNETLKINTSEGFGSEPLAP
ncbi:hypothetical protein FB472_0358 [Rhodoglobus vestalii]|uniref:Uncharacterized protein n=1 Tax=Rhodoglobus vestalii TaxID=193384 RepID=A0A8H2PWZ6_9MICO|nr:hypothetical protein [Rhodoglobus vestalii]TQO18834.1 hypothetical protein FB472_0358 [Rhodoglobus vestalii]